MVLSEQDVLDLAVTIEPGSSAAVVVWENLWAAPFGSAVRKAGGQLVATGRIPTQAVLAAIEADARGRSLTCPWLTDVGAGGLPLSAEPSLSPTATTAGRTGATTGATAVDRRDDRRDRRSAPMADRLPRAGAGPPPPSLR